MKKRWYIVGIDLGGTTAKLGLMDSENRSGKILDRLIIASNDTEDANVFVKNLCRAILELLSRNNLTLDDVLGIGIGAPNGNSRTGEIDNAANLRWGIGKVLNLPEMIRKQLESQDIKVKLLNDSDCASIGEMTHGSAKNKENFIMITLGTGVGSGIVINGKILQGHIGHAGELGHTIAVRHTGRLCTCGKQDCLETYASAGGVGRTAMELLTANPERESSLREITYPLTSKEVSAAAESGDLLAQEAWELTASVLGHSLADFCCFTEPEAIILFGGVTNAGDFLLKPLKKHFENNLLNLWKGRIDIKYSSLEESDAGILGAASLVLDTKYHN